MYKTVLCSAERQKSEVKIEVDAMVAHQLHTINPSEEDFWENLRQKCLLPDSVAFAHDVDLKGMSFAKCMKFEFRYHGIHCTYLMPNTIASSYMLFAFSKTLSLK